MKALRVILADDHTLVRAGLRSLIEQLKDVVDSEFAKRALDSHRLPGLFRETPAEIGGGLDVAARLARVRYRGA